MYQRKQVDNGYILGIGERFFQFLDDEGYNDVTDKEELRSIFYDEFKLYNRIEKCSYSKMIYILARNKIIRVRYGDIYRQRAYYSVAVDQYRSAWRFAEEGPESRQEKVYPCNCSLCFVPINSAVVFLEHVKGKRHRLNMLKRDINSNRGDLVENKGGIRVISPFDVDRGEVVTSMQIGQSKQVPFTITAEGVCVLKSIVLLNYRPEFRVSDPDQVYDGRYRHTMIPGSKYNVTLTCNGTTNPGRLSSPVVFVFSTGDPKQDFQIMRFVDIMVVGDVNADLPPSTPYIRPQRFAPRERRENILEGDPPSYHRNNPLKGTALPMFHVPRELTSRVNQNKDLIELKNQLVSENHKERFHTLLYVEELQMRVDIHRYDTKGQKLSKDRNPMMLRLHVPGLAENRPSVLKGDHLFARFSDETDDKTYKGYVHKVELEDVVLSFHRDFLQKYVNGMKVDIEFTFSRYPLRNQHQAVETAIEENDLADALFPETSGKIGTKKALCEIPDPNAFLKLYDKKLEDNPEQLEAVRSIVRGISRPAPYLVFGPPGTGKTVTIVEAAKQVYYNLSKSRILLSAPSNSAADLVAARLLGKGTPIAKTHLMRFYAPSRSLLSLDPDLKDCCNLRDGELFIPTKDEIKAKRVIVTTLVNAGRLALAEFPRDHFTHVFIDEAGHATEPEALIPLSGLLNLDNPDGGQLVMAGDPKQLGPVLRSSVSIKKGLAMSFLERLMTKCPVYARKTMAVLNEGGEDEEKEPYDDRVLTKLLLNYRSHPDILKLPNEEFYDNELKVHADQLVRESFCMWEELPKRGFPIIFHGVEGTDEREGQSPSFFNTSEVQIVVDYVKKVMDKRGGQKIKEEDIGVISPYRKQVEKLRLVLKKRRYEKIKVGSVEEFQGQERLVIIISTVRSTKADFIEMDMKFKLGFLKNPKRYNVSVTRAKALLVIVGNPFMLSKDKHWNEMLEFCYKEGGYRGCKYDPEEKDVDEIIQKMKIAGLGTIPTEEEVEKGLEISQITHQEDPEWKADI